MAIKTKSIADVAIKWTQRASAAAPDYNKGIAAPSKDWATETKAAEGAYQAGVQDAISRSAFGKGVSKAGSEKWSRKALAVGPARYGQGVTAAQQDYTADFGPYLDALGRIVLPPRGKRGDPANIERVRTIATALHSQKTGQS
jgi:hypothetical protein